jgi:hypothetical protein
MNDLVKRTTKMGIVPDGETIEGVGDFIPVALIPVAFLPKYAPKSVGLRILTYVAVSLLANLMFGSSEGPGSPGFSY